MSKVYKTSIIPAGEKLETLGQNQAQASSFSIEIIHIVFFVGIILFIFKTLWKESKETNKVSSK